MRRHRALDLRRILQPAPRTAPSSPRGEICDGDCACGGATVNVSGQEQYESAISSIQLGQCGCPLEGAVECLDHVCTVCARLPSDPPACQMQAGRRAAPELRGHRPLHVRHVLPARLGLRRNHGGHDLHGRLSVRRRGHQHGRSRPLRHHGECAGHLAGMPLRGRRRRELRPEQVHGLRIHGSGARTGMTLNLAAHASNRGVGTSTLGARSSLLGASSLLLGATSPLLGSATPLPGATVPPLAAGTSHLAASRAFLLAGTSLLDAGTSRLASGNGNPPAGNPHLALTPSHLVAGTRLLASGAWVLGAVCRRCVPVRYGGAVRCGGAVCRRRVAMRWWCRVATQGRRAM